MSVSGGILERGVQIPYFLLCIYGVQAVFKAVHMLWLKPVLHALEGAEST